MIIFDQKNYLDDRNSWIHTFPLYSHCVSLENWASDGSKLLKNPENRDFENLFAPRNLCTILKKSILEIYRLNRFEDLGLKSTVLRSHFTALSKRDPTDSCKKPNIIVKFWSRRICKKYSRILKFSFSVSNVSASWLELRNLKIARALRSRGKKFWHEVS